MRVIELKRRKVNKFPTSITLPRDFIRANRIKKGDTVIIYMTEAHELIIKKEVV